MIAQELVLYKKPTISTEDFTKSLFEFSDEYLTHSNGFINRVFSKKSDDEWLLFMFYDKEEDAHDCIKKYYSWDKSKNLLTKIKNNNLEFNCYQMCEGLI